VKISVGRQQMLIMEVLWSRGEATAKEITEGVTEMIPTTLSTVQTLLRKLITKGAVAHEQRGRTFWFKPAVDRSAVERSASQELVERVFGGSVKGLVAHLLSEEAVSAEELAEIKAMIEQKEREVKP